MLDPKNTKKEGYSLCTKKVFSHASPLLNNNCCNIISYQVYVLNEGHGDDLLVVVGVDEVDVVGQPADREDDHHHHEHLDNLFDQIKFFL